MVLRHLSLKVSARHYEISRPPLLVRKILRAISNENTIPAGCTAGASAHAPVFALYVGPPSGTANFCTGCADFKASDNSFRNRISGRQCAWRCRPDSGTLGTLAFQIGRASCRERV